MEKTYKFHVEGMHCKSCVAVTESELMELSEVKEAKASLSNNSVTIKGDFGDKNPEHIAEDLSVLLKPHGYSLKIEKETSNSGGDFVIAVPVALIFIGLFIFLQKIGLVNLIGSSDMTYGTAFIIGLVASVSSCMAVVGGLVLSMSANFAKEGNKFRPQIMFHAGRIISFFILGGIVGAIGASFQLGATGSFLMSAAVAVILLILGINLLDIFPWARNIQPTMPVFFGKKIRNLKNINHFLMPALIGVATFFLPCGFTQSMQIYSLTTGSFIKGGLTMLIFALGTFPVLALLSFSSLTIQNKKYSGIFFKSIGLIVIFFGLLNLISSLVAVGFISPFFNL
jgi:sulfite exporter TauE/SafE/copper chaperone CopZ